MAPRNKRGERTGRKEDGTKVVLPGSSKGARPVKGKFPVPGKKRPGKTQPGKRNPKLDVKFPVPGKKRKPKKPGTPVIGPAKVLPVKGKFPVPGKKRPGKKRPGKTLF